MPYWKSVLLSNRIFIKLKNSIISWHYDDFSTYARVEFNLDIRQTRQNQFPRLLSYCTRKMNDTVFYRREKYLNLSRTINVMIKN